MIELYVQVLNEYANKNMLNWTSVCSYIRLLINTESEHTQKVSQLQRRNQAYIDTFFKKEGPVLLHPSRNKNN